LTKGKLQLEIQEFPLTLQTPRSVQTPRSMQTPRSISKLSTRANSMVADPSPANSTQSTMCPGSPLRKGGGSGHNPAMMSYTRHPPPQPARPSTAGGKTQPDVGARAELEDCQSGPLTKMMTKKGVFERGGHNSYIVRDLAPRADPWFERSEHDRSHAEALHHRLPGEEQQAALPCPASRAPAAFPDRASRLREGRALKHTFAGQAQAKTPRLLRSSSAQVHRMAPAGGACASHSLNAQPLCGKHVDPDDEFLQGPMSPTYDSRFATQSLPHAHILGGHPVDELYHEGFTSKAKGPDLVSPRPSGMHLHRSLSADPAAGDFDQVARSVHCTRRKMARQSWQRSPFESNVRLGATVCLGAEHGDPGVPEQVTTAMRGRGTFRDEFTRQAVYHSEYYNMEQQRYAHAERSRGKSQPPPGRHQAWDCGNPVTGAGKAAPHVTLAMVKSPMPARPVPTFRTAECNDSARIQGALDQGRALSLDAEARALRMDADPAFRRLCAYTSYSKDTSGDQAAFFKGTCKASEGVRDALAWGGDGA